MDANHSDRVLSITKTGDGSDTLYSTEFSAHYHSTHGAIQESNHVFIDAGLAYCRDQYHTPIKVLEIGFGTGLNAFLSLQFSNANAISIDYHTIEAYPVTFDIVESLNYTKDPILHKAFLKLHRLSWNATYSIDSHFIFHKSLGLFEKVELFEDYSVIFFDAFAPGCQPHLWEASFLQRICDKLRPGGILVTYCAQGAFKRTLKSIGMQVDGIPGPPGKREMTRAIKL